MFDVIVIKDPYSKANLVDLEFRNDVWAGAVRSIPLSTHSNLYGGI